MVKKIETYENMVKSLEETIEKMENPEATLLENMKNYENGVILCNKLYKILNEAENKIKLITEDGEINFNSEEE